MKDRERDEWFIGSRVKRKEREEDGAWEHTLALMIVMKDEGVFFFVFLGPSYMIYSFGK